jgi:hypothetical protein
MGVFNFFKMPLCDYVKLVDSLDDLLQQDPNPIESANVTKFRQFFTWLDYIHSVLLTAHPVRVSFLALFVSENAII